MDAKLEAFIQPDKPERAIWIDSLSSWPEGYLGSRVKATGIVIQKYDLPVFIQKEGEPVRTGIPVPEGTDLHSASRRYLLKNAKWSKID